jgi:hypothetical protein
MQVTQERLQAIILEEYLMEEGILDEEMSDERKKEMIDWIKGRGPRPKWATDDLGTSRRGKGAQAPAGPSVDRAADTMPLPADDMPQYDDEYVDDGGAYDPEAEALEDSGPDEPEGSELVDQITALIQGMPPEDVSNLFQTVFLNIPGVEIGPPEEARLPTEYGGEEYELRKKQGRTIGIKEEFELGDLQDLIREVLKESAPFHDMFDDYVPFETELSQKVVDAGGSVDEATMSVKPKELGKQLWEWLKEAAYDAGRIGVDELKEMHLDVIERILDMQANNENV